MAAAKQKKASVKKAKAKAKPKAKRKPKVKAEFISKEEMKAVKGKQADGEMVKIEEGEKAKQELIKKRYASYQKDLQSLYQKWGMREIGQIRKIQTQQGIWVDEPMVATEVIPSNGKG